MSTQVKIARTILPMAILAVALAGHAQQHDGRGDGHRGGDRGGYGGYGHGGPAYGRGGPPYGGQRYAPQGYAPRGYPSQPYSDGMPYAHEPVGGRWRDQEEFVRQGVRQGQLAPLGRVIESIRHLTPGRQLDAGLEYMGPRLVYRVRWMTARGRRIDYFVDAATGAILSDR